MKKLIYQIEGYTDVYNPETKEVEQQLSLATVSVECATKAEFDTLYATAKEVAVGKIIVEGEFEPKPAPEPSDDSVWDELDAAYQEGVNSAYDQ